MNKAFTRYYNYLFGIAITGVIALVAILPYFLIKNLEVWPFDYVRNVSLFGGIVVFGLGFVIQDFYRAYHRKKTNNWSEPLPPQIVDKAWAIFCPFVIGGVLALIMGAVFAIPGVSF